LPRSTKQTALGVMLIEPKCYDDLQARHSLQGPANRYHFCLRENWSKSIHPDGITLRLRTLTARLPG
ncbi:MAG: hypothetical protein ACUVQG_14755, partial [Thermogutta sp.]